MADDPEATHPSEVVVAVSTERAVSNKRNETNETETRKCSFLTGLSNKGACFWTSVIIALACIVLVVVVPPVCVLRGCERPEQVAQSTDEVYRLIVSFTTVEKTVKSFVPATLHGYVEELLLASSGLHIVSFNNSDIKAVVQKRIEEQPDLELLLEDRIFFSGPYHDLLGGETAKAKAEADMRLDEFAAAAAAKAAASAGTSTGRRLAGAAVDYEDSLWQRKVVNYDGAWNITRGVPNVVIAIIDTGCDLGHPDLRDNLWVNQLEAAGVSGVDDDGNGLVDDVYGYDFTASLPLTASPQDIHSHGTHCAGIAAAPYNGQGVSGVAPNVKIMCLKVAWGQAGQFYTSAVLRAYDYAYSMGAHIVSCSFGPEFTNFHPAAKELETMANETKAYRQALQPLVKKDMLIFASAGNEDADLNQLAAVNSTYNPCTMARYFPNNMMCVMATDPQDARFSDIVQNVKVGTNYGTNVVDIAAPGTNILSTVPSLFVTGNSLYVNRTGSSASTPLVAGVAALVLSVLGPGSNNFYQGADALKYLVDSADRIPNLPVRTSSRVNAYRAVARARASLINLVLLSPNPGFSQAKQSVMLSGFNETYYAGDIGLSDQDFSLLPTYDTSARFSKSYFDSYKYGAGYTLLLRASVFLNQSGIYLLKVNTTANAGDLVIKFGQSRLTNISQPVQLSTETAGGWYDFQVRYRNPSAAIDIRMALPGSGGAAADYQYLNVFFTNTDAQPRNLYYAPDIALSSAFQVLTRPVDASTITRNSIADGPYPRLQIDQPYNYSSVVPDLAFTDMSTGLRDALYPNMAAPAAVVGIVHTRLRAPDVPMRFQLTCQLCSLYINSLQVLDVFGSSLNGGSIPTRLSGCLTQLSGNGVGTHDLTIRFALPNTAAAGFKLAWMRCDSGAATATASVTTHVANNLLWKPSSGVAGYVPGMQCDVWPDELSSDKGYVRPYPDQSQPWLKFRLPVAITQTAKGFSNSSMGNNVYKDFAAPGCRGDNESFSSGCYSYASFTLADVFPDIGSQVSLTDTIMHSVYVRCYTYVNRGFKNGVSQFRLSNTKTIYGFLGSQNIFHSVDATGPRPPLNAASLAPNATSLGGYYQLLVMECRSAAPYTTPIGILDGLTPSLAADNFRLDMSATLLPIPVVTSRPTARLLAAGQEAALPATTGGGTGGSASSFSATQPSGAEQPSSSSSSASLEQAGCGGGGLQPSSSSSSSSLAQAGSGSGSRSLLQAATSAAGYQPLTPGASDWSLAQVALPTQRVTATVLQPNASAPYETFTGFASLVVNNVSGTAVAGVVSREGSLSGTVALPTAGAGSNRYVRIEGFMKSPAAAGQMATYVLRVKDGEGQGVAITMGNITVRNAVEFPTRTVLETRGEIVLPAGYVPTLVTVKTKRADSNVVLDAGVKALGSTAVEAPLEWYSMAAGASSPAT